MADSDEQSSISGWFRRQIPFKDLAIFSGNLATCLEAGLSLHAALETSTRSSPSPLLRLAGPGAAELARAGKPLSETLDRIAAGLPRFYLPVLRCGDQSGRSDEALRYLQQHCELLVRPSEAMRNLWFVPLVVFSVGSLITVLTYFVFAPFITAVRFFLATAANYATLAAGVVLVVKVPPLRRLGDQLFLTLPVLGAAYRELAVNRFFHAFNLMYCTGGLSVAQMVRTASATVDNLVIREQILAAVPKLEHGHSLSDSLATCPGLTHDEKTTLQSGEQAGRIEQSLKTLCRQTSESAHFRLAGFQAIFFRVMIYYVVFSTALTVASLAIASRW